MKCTLAVLTLALCATAAMAQEPGPRAPQNEDDAILIAQSGPGAPEAMQDRQPGPPGEAPMAPDGMKRRSPMKFWNDSEIATKINLTDQQKQQLESSFTNYRLKLIDQRAAVEREEVKLEPLLQSDRLDESAITHQIDALIAARGQLEKTTAMMGVDIRKVLTTDQWKQLKELRGRGMGMGMGRGMGAGKGREKMREEFRRRRGGPDDQTPPPPDGDKGPK
jgi:periplasmic protein CpxP/Spy